MTKEARATTDRKPKEKRWKEILDVAAEVFYEKGYDASSLQEIADQVGILKGSIYYYIKTKRDLLDNLLIEVHKGGIARLRHLAATEGPPLTKLYATIYGHVQFICENLAKTTVYLHELQKLKPEQRAELIGLHEFRDEFLQLIREGQSNGDILPDLDPKLTSQALLGAINSSYQWYRPNRGKPSAQVAEYFAITSLRGIATSKGIKAIEKLAQK